MTNEHGAKYDEGKLKWHLLPPSMRYVVETYTSGCTKYSDYNWRRGIAFSRLFSAMLRHAWAFWWGGDRDPENGQKHLASVVFYALAMMQYGDEDRTDLDDRFEGGRGCGVVSDNDTDGGSNKTLIKAELICRKSGTINQGYVWEEEVEGAGPGNISFMLWETGRSAKLVPLRDISLGWSTGRVGANRPTSSLFEAVDAGDGDGDDDGGGDDDDNDEDSDNDFIAAHREGNGILFRENGFIRRADVYKHDTEVEFSHYEDGRDPHMVAKSEIILGHHIDGLNSRREI